MTMWGDSRRDSDLISADWPTYRATLRTWAMLEMAQKADDTIYWFDRRLSTPEGRLKMDGYDERAAALASYSETEALKCCEASRTPQ